MDEIWKYNQYNYKPSPFIYLFFPRYENIINTSSPRGILASVILLLERTLKRKMDKIFIKNNFQSIPIPSFLLSN